MADNKDKKVLKVPDLRFPEFTDEWERKKFRDVCNITTGNKNTQDKSNDGIYPFYVRSQIVERINSWTFDGEAILTAGDGVGVGKVFHYSTGKIGVHQRVYILSDFKCDGKYLYSYFAGHFYNRVKRMSAKNSVDSVRMEMIADMPISLPSTEEQKKIGHLLALLDERIATQTKIIEKLQSLIKGLRVCCMQRVYGNNVYLSEIAQIYQPQTISSTELTEDGFLVYGANGIIGKYKDYNHETEQICITCRGNTCGMVNYTKPMSWITGNAMVINTDKYQDKVCKRYLYHYLSAYNFNSIISGSGQPQIVRTPLEKLKITLPTISEQKQKAIIFDKIQDKIDINHKVLNLYIGQKQYLLRQMFI